MLALLALGLAAFVLWQVVLAVFDPEHRRARRTIRRRAVRLGHLFNGALHVVLIADACHVCSGSAERMTQGIRRPFGRAEQWRCRSGGG